MRARCIALPFVFLAALAAVAGAVPQEIDPDAFRAAFDAYRAGRYDEALARFEPLAAAGDDSAATVVGNILARGLAREATESDVARGLELVRGAAERGWPDARRVLGDYHAEGIGVPRDADLALEHYLQASDNPKTQAGVARLLVQAEREPEQLERLHEQLASGGWPTSLDAWLRRSVVFGSVFVDSAWFDQAGRRADLALVSHLAASGNEAAQEHLANLATYGNDPLAEIELAIAILQGGDRFRAELDLGAVMNGCLAGVPQAEYARGLYHARRLEHDPAAHWHFRAAKGDDRALLEIATRMPVAWHAPIFLALAHEGLPQAFFVLVNAGQRDPAFLTLAGRAAMDGVLVDGNMAERFLRGALAAGDVEAVAYLAEVLTTPPPGGPAPTPERLAEASELLFSGLDRGSVPAAKLVSHLLGSADGLALLGDRHHEAVRRAVAVLERTAQPELENYRHLVVQTGRAGRTPDAFCDFDAGLALILLYADLGRWIPMAELAATLRDIDRFQTTRMEMPMDGPGNFIPEILVSDWYWLLGETEREIVRRALAGSEGAAIVDSYDELGIQGLSKSLDAMIEEVGVEAVALQFTTVPLPERHPAIDLNRARSLVAGRVFETAEELGYADEAAFEAEVLGLVRPTVEDGWAESLDVLFELVADTGSEAALEMLRTRMEAGGVDEFMPPDEFHELRGRLATLGLLDADPVLEARAAELVRRSDGPAHGVRDQDWRSLGWELPSKYAGDLPLILTLPPREQTGEVFVDRFNATDAETKTDQWDRFLATVRKARHPELLTEARDSVDHWAEQGNRWARLYAPRIRGLEQEVCRDREGALERATAITRDAEFTFRERAALLEELAAGFPRDAEPYAALRSELAIELVALGRSMREQGRRADALHMGLELALEVFDDAPEIEPFFRESLAELDALAVELAAGVRMEIPIGNGVVAPDLRPCTAELLLGAERWSAILAAPASTARIAVVSELGEPESFVEISHGYDEARKVIRTVVETEWREVSHWNEWRSELRRARNEADRIAGMIHGLADEYEANESKLDPWSAEVREFRNGLSTMAQAYRGVKDIEWELWSQGPPPNTMEKHEYETQAEVTEWERIVVFAGRITLEGTVRFETPDGRRDRVVRAQVPWEGTKISSDFGGGVPGAMEAEAQRRLTTALGATITTAWSERLSSELNWYVLPEIRAAWCREWAERDAASRLSESDLDRQRRVLLHYFSDPPGGFGPDVPPEW